MKERVRLWLRSEILLGENADARFPLLRQR